MRRFAILSATILAMLAIPFGVNGQESKPKAATKPTSKPAAQPAVPPPLNGGAIVKPTPGQASPATQSTPATPQRSPDELAVIQTGATYVAAFNKHDAKAIADHYTTNAEYIDEHGQIIVGRGTIEDSLKRLFTAHPDCSIEMHIASLRIVGPAVAIEDGTTTVTLSKDSEPVTSRYTAVHQKDAGKWLVASVREATMKSVRPHRSQLKQLDWMLGEWVHEGSDAVVFFTCELADRGNFLIRNFTIQIAGQEAVSGSQRIGWDAQQGKLKAWIFDSDGGHSEGYWHRDGDNWVLKTTGVTADGLTASSTSIYSFVNEHTMTFQSVDHEVSGMELPDSAKVKIVRHAPQPE